MKTEQINIQLMQEGQINKELIFNEAMIKIDSLTNIVIEDFAYESDIMDDNSYIILDEKNQNSISYKNINSDKRQCFLPCKMLIVFILKQNSFYIFKANNWQKLSFDSEKQDPDQYEYSSASGQVYINSTKGKFTYLYLNGDTEIKIDKPSNLEFHIIIKQNHNEIFNVEIGNNILWPKEGKYKATKTKGSIDIINFFKLAREDHYLATYNTNYQY